MGDFVQIAPLTYGGKKDCTNAMCRRQFVQNDDGSWTPGECIGWHCSYCDAATSYQGHNCDAAVTFVAEARRIAEEQGAVPPGVGESE